MVKIIKIWKSYKKESKIDWGETLLTDESPSDDRLRLGCQMRIAETLEKIEKHLARIEKRFLNEKTK